jgi:hypothetical protein
MSRSPEIETLAGQIANRITAEIGTNWQTVFIDPAVEEISKKSIINRYSEIPTRKETVETLLLIGYEIGDKEDLGLFADELADCFYETDVFNHEVVGYRERIANIRAEIKSILSLGASIKSNPQGASLTAFINSGELARVIDAL